MSRSLSAFGTLALAALFLQGRCVALDSAALDVGEKADAAVSMKEAASWQLPLVGGGVKTNSNLTEGNLFLVQPLIDTLGKHGSMGGGVLFVEPYFSWAEGGEFSGSVGLGFRHLFNSQTPETAARTLTPGFLGEGAYVGANVFADYVHSRNDSDLWQLGVGAEAGTRYIELRGNYYIPLNDGDTIARFKVMETEHAYKGGHLRSITTRTRTIELVEEPMGGWDTELALLVPGLDRWCEVNVIGGYFSFQGNGAAPGGSSDLGGWKAGVEVRPVPAVVLSAMWYEDERLVQDNWQLALRLEIPLGKPDSFVPRRRHLQERMLEPVSRQNSPINVETNAQQAGPTTTKTKIIPQPKPPRAASPAQAPIAIAAPSLYVSYYGWGSYYSSYYYGGYYSSGAIIGSSISNIYSSGFAISLARPTSYYNSYYSGSLGVSVSITQPSRSSLYWSGSAATSVLSVGQSWNTSISTLQTSYW